MDAQQLASDDGEQRSGYRCSRTMVGVRKRLAVAVVGCAHVWVQQGAAGCMKSLEHELALDSGAAMARDGDMR